MSSHSAKNGSHTSHIEYGGPSQGNSTVKSPNALARYRHGFRIYFAEFIGTLILVLFGTSVNCQVNLAPPSSPKGDYLSVSFGWGIGLGIGVWVAGAISGGHLNPAVTIALAAFRRFPWRRVPGYVVAQVLGAIVGAAITYANYHTAISIVEGGDHIRTLKTAGNFGTFAADYMTAVSCFFEQFLGTAVLMLGILAVTDGGNGPPPAGLAPLVLVLLLTGIAACFGAQTGFAVNPARDFGPRVLTAMVGYGGEVFSFRNQYWIWCPIIAPILGALAATILYDLFIFVGDDSLLARSLGASGVDAHRELRSPDEMA